MFNRKRYWATPTFSRAVRPRFGAMVTCHLGSLDLDGASGQEMPYAAATFDHDRSSGAGLRRQSPSSSADPKVKTAAAVYEWELDGAERFRPMWAEYQPVVACFQSGETPLQQIDATGHCGQVYSFRCGAALDVDDIGTQYLQKYFMGLCRLARARTHEWTIALSVHPSEVRER